MYFFVTCNFCETYVFGHTLTWCGGVRAIDACHQAERLSFITFCIRTANVLRLVDKHRSFSRVVYVLSVTGLLLFPLNESICQINRVCDRTMAGQVRAYPAAPGAFATHGVPRLPAGSVSWQSFFGFHVSRNRKKSEPRQWTEVKYHTMLHRNVAQEYNNNNNNNV